MLDLEKIKPEIVNLCQRLKVTRLDLFGSAATEAFRPQSDVDVLVEFDQNLGNMFNRYFELKEGLEKITGRSVDVVMEDAIKYPYFKISVEQTRKPVYAA
jgi:predicted nucleotidyltransferase